MLNAYIASTQALLQNPPAPTSLYTTANLTTFINTGRGQLAGDSESIRNYATLPLVIGQRVYPFSDIALGSPSAGIQGVFNIRTSWYMVGSGQKWMRPRPFEWFSLYLLNNPVPSSGPPARWAQYGQGVTGSIFVDPLPDAAYTLQLDTQCYPIPLVDDTTTEAIPYPWTDAVPYFAAYLALLSAQSAARQADADRMFARYTEFTNRARRFSNQSVTPYIYPQSGDPVRANKLGSGAGQPGGGGAP